MGLYIIIWDSIQLDEKQCIIYGIPKLKVLGLMCSVKPQDHIQNKGTLG